MSSTWEALFSSPLSLLGPLLPSCLSQSPCYSPLVTIQLFCSTYCSCDTWSPQVFANILKVHEARNPVFVHHGNVVITCLAHWKHPNIYWMTERLSFYHSLFQTPGNRSKTNLTSWSTFPFLATQTTSSYLWMCTGLCICLPGCTRTIYYWFKMSCNALSNKGGI